MKILAFLLLLTPVFSITDAQTEKHTISNNVPDCHALRYQAIQLIPRLFTDNKTDSLYSIVTAWETHCSASEPIVSFTILNEIFRKTFYARNDTAFFIQASDIYLYKQQIAAYKERYLFGSDIDPVIVVKDSADMVDAVYNNYYIFLQSLALYMLNEPGLTQLEQTLVLYYANPLRADTARLWELIQSSRSGSYKVNNTKNRKQRNFGFGQKGEDGFGNELGIISGIWIPTGQLWHAGPHTFLGLTWGFEFNRLYLCLDGNVRMANAQPFSLKYNDTIYSSTCSGAYFGLDWRYHLNLLDKNELCLVGGIAIDGTEVSLNTHRTVDLTAPNINIGLGYQLLFYHKPRKRAIGSSNIYLLLEAKYNYVNYQSQGFSGIGGNSFTLSLSARYLYQWWLAGERP